MGVRLKILYVSPLVLNLVCAKNFEDLAIIALQLYLFVMIMVSLYLGLGYAQSCHFCSFREHGLE